MPASHGGVTRRSTIVAVAIVGALRHGWNEHAHQEFRNEQVIL
jgi:hypothetical protein